MGKKEQTRNLTVRYEKCSFCSAYGRLSSYDAMRAKSVFQAAGGDRILDKCASCGRQEKQSLDEYYGAKLTHVAQLDIETEKNKNDNAFLQRAARAYFSIGFYDKAMQLLETLAERKVPFEIADYLRGKILFAQGKIDQSLPYLERAAANKSGDNALLQDLAQSYEIVNNYDKARQSYARMMGNNPDDTKAYWHIQRLDKKIASQTGLEPETLDDEPQRRTRMVPQDQPLVNGRSPQFRRKRATISAIMLLIALLAMLHLYGKTHNRLLIDNPLPVAVVVIIDNRVPIELPALGQAILADMSTGRHSIQIQTPQARLLSRNTFELVGRRPFGYPPTHALYSVLGLGAYRRRKEFFRPPQTPPHLTNLQEISEKSFLEFTDADFFFTKPSTAEKLELIRSGKPIDVIERFPGGLPGYVDELLERADQVKAERLWKNYLRFVPSNGDIGDLERSLALTQGHKNTAKTRQLLSSFRNDAGDDILKNRYYQDTIAHSWDGWGQVAKEYRALAAQNPGSAAYNYLLGRSLNDPKAATASYNKALRFDPSANFPHLGLSQVALFNQNPQEATRQLEQFLAKTPAKNHLRHSAGVGIVVINLGTGNYKKAQTALNSYLKDITQNPQPDDLLTMVSLGITNNNLKAIWDKLPHKNNNITWADVQNLAEHIAGESTERTNKGSPAWSKLLDFLSATGAGKLEQASQIAAKSGPLAQLLGQLKLYLFYPYLVLKEIGDQEAATAYLENLTTAQQELFGGLIAYLRGQVSYTQISQDIHQPFHKEEFWFILSWNERISGNTKNMRRALARMPSPEKPYSINQRLAINRSLTNKQ